jgi:hypothetical protein
MVTKAVAQHLNHSEVSILLMLLTNKVAHLLHDFPFCLLIHFSFVSVCSLLRVVFPGVTVMT